MSLTAAREMCECYNLVQVIKKTKCHVNLPDNLGKKEKNLQICAERQPNEALQFQLYSPSCNSNVVFHGAQSRHSLRPHAVAAGIMNCAICGVYVLN